jgi:hypothetical protein
MEFKEKTVDSLGPAVGSKPVINFRFVADNFSFVPGLRIRICIDPLNAGFGSTCKHCSYIYLVGYIKALRHCFSREVKNYETRKGYSRNK